MKNKLNTKGEVDYDYKNDILFFKTSERDYEKSMELENIVLDIDKKGFIVGFQLFDASKFLNLNKDSLLNIPKWHFDTKIAGGKIEIRLVFQVKVRNKLVEKNPIIMQTISEKLPDSQMICEA